MTAGGTPAASAPTVVVADSFGVADDPAMPALARALDGDEVVRQLGALTGLTSGTGRVGLLGGRVLRYKAGRRCLIEYTVNVERPDGATEVVRLVGKVRRRRSGASALHLLEALWTAGFAAESADGISVPEPIGALPELGMWLQRAVAGRPATELLAGLGGRALARRIAEAAHKLHGAGIPVKRCHTMADELGILRERLAVVASAESRWARRIQRLLSRCEQLAASVPRPVACGIHRDFYPDHVMVDGDRLHLIDFDCYCWGDPAVDIGNFIGHVREHSLRVLGDPGALVGVEQALADRFAELVGAAVRPAVSAYAILTQVRHIHLSAVLPGRRGLTGRLLELCEEALGMGVRSATR
jgi:aminoglycoside phosphotransferase (APT) family kinase protein